MSEVKLPSGFLEKAQELAEKKTLRVLHSIGMECVDEAVSSGNYSDNTGNLRSSVGFVVCKDGEVVSEGGFWHIGEGEGASIGREGASARGAQTSGIALIIVAGMKYAQFVSDKGYNVLDSAEILAHRLIAQLNG